MGGLVYNLGCGSLGNGVVVWNSLKQVHGDYERIAHINYQRVITWTLKNPPNEVLEYVNEIATGSNFNVSSTQKDKWVFEN
jgi:hypothetical protein